MSKFTPVYKEIKALEAKLKKTANKLWDLQHQLTEAYDQGLTEGDFLPRRILLRKQEEQLVFEKLLHKLNGLINYHLSKDFIVFSSVEDIQTMMSIRRTMKYIKNAFSSEPALVETLEKLNKALPYHTMPKTPGRVYSI